MKKYTQTQKADAQRESKIPDDMLLELIDDYTEYHRWLNAMGFCDILKFHIHKRLEDFWSFADSRGLEYSSNWRKELYEK